VVSNGLSELFTSQSVDTENVSFLGLAACVETGGWVARWNESSHQMGVQSSLGLTRAFAVNDAAGIVSSDGRVVSKNACHVTGAGVELLGGVGTILVALGNTSTNGHSDSGGLVAGTGAFASTESTLEGDNAVSKSVNALAHSDAAPSLKCRVRTVSVALWSVGSHQVASGINISLVFPASSVGFRGNGSHGYAQEYASDDQSECLHCDEGN